MPFRLTLFGPIDLWDTSGASVIGGLQRRPLALLALLAVSGSSGLSRDAVVALLWPESDQERARQSLRQALFQLRQRVHADVVIGTVDLRIDAALLTSDVEEFRRAIKDNDADTAVRVYRGPLLAGFHLRGVPEFENWIATERERLFRQFARAVDAAATRADSDVDPARAAALSHQLLAQDPLSSPAVLRYARALAALGDAAGAVRAIDSHERLIKRDLELPLDEELRRLRASLLERSREVAVASASPIHERSGDARDAARPELARHTIRRRRVGAVTVAISTVLVLAFVLVRRAPRESPRATRASGPVLVIPFSVTGDSASAALGRAGTEIVAAAIGAVDTVRGIAENADTTLHALAVTPAAARLAADSAHARAFVTGTIVSDRAQVEITAELHSTRAPDVVIARTSAFAPRARAVDAYTQAGATLAAAFLGPEPQLRIPTAVANTHSREALLAFLRGEAEFGRQHFLDAVTAFHAATQIDSTFTLAWYRLAEALDWAGGAGWRVAEASARAHALAERLPVRARRLVDAAYYWRRGDSDDAERLCRSVAEQQPSDLEAASLMAEILFHDNPLRGRPIGEAAPYFERIVASDSDNYDALSHLHRIRLALRQYDDAARLEHLMTRLRPPSSGGDAGYYDALVRGSPAQVAAVLRQAHGRSVDWVSTMSNRAFVYGDARATAPLLDRVIAGADRPLSEREAGLFNLVQIAASRGRLREADSLLGIARTLRVTFVHPTSAELALLPYRPNRVTALTRALADIHAWQPSVAVNDTLEARTMYAYEASVSDPAVRRYYIAVIDAALGDDNGARAELEVLRRPVPARFAETTHELAAAVDVELALRARRQPVIPPTGTNLPGLPVSRARQRFQLARALEASGDVDDALRWYDSFEFSWTEGEMYAVPGHLARARLFARLGRRTDAARELDRAELLWRDADPELKEIVAAERAAFDARQLASFQAKRPGS